MLNIIRLIFAICVILLVVPQTQTENVLLRIFYRTRLFTNYGQAKNILNLMTWISIFIFLFLTFTNYFQ